MKLAEIVKPHKLLPQVTLTAAHKYISAIPQKRVNILHLGFEHPNSKSHTQDNSHQ